MHYYWIGAVPAMVFLGIVMMPFYYGSKVRSVPEYLRRRFDHKTHLVNAIIVRRRRMLIAGVNLYALALVMQALLGWPLWSPSCSRPVFVLTYILLGGLTSAIYNEVMQFFVILAGLIPIADRRADGGRRHRRRCSTSCGNGAKLRHAVAGHRVRRRQPVRRLVRASCSASRSACRSDTGPPTSPRCSGRCRPRTTTPPG